MKLKTHKGMAKRIKITKKGKFKRRSAVISHLRRKKTSRIKRAHEGLFDVSGPDKKRVELLLPYFEQ